MLLIGLLLILAAVGITVGAVYDGGDPVTVEVLGRSTDTTVAGVFFAGAATMLLFMVGAWALQSSMGRARRRRAERRELRERHHDSVARLEEERTALRAENERLAEQLSGPGAGFYGTRRDTTTADGRGADSTHIDLRQDTADRQYADDHGRRPRP
ncbi:MAG TPA: hypothetical protein VF314_00700 [Actinomycetes bacterium]